MKKIQLAYTSLFLFSGIALAATPCEQFQINVKNKLPSDLAITKINLSNGDFQPKGIQLLKHGTEQAFLVSNSAPNQVMVGEIVADTVSLPIRKVHIQFQLENKGVVCTHEQLNTSDSDAAVPVDTTRLPGKVTYTIG